MPWLLAATLLLAAGVAWAQSGGSMGGGSWGGSHSSGGSHSGGGSYSGGDSYGSSSHDSRSSWGGSRSSSRSSSPSSWSSGDSGGGGIGPGALLVLTMFGVVGFITYIAVTNKPDVNPSHLAMGQGEPSAWGRAEADVSVLRLALDARVRKFVQAELLRLGKSADTTTAEGRAAMLREVALLLRRTRDAWVYGGAVNLPMTTMDEAKRQFDHHVSDARGRFVYEVVRNQQGVITTAQAPALPSASSDGPGLVVVTVVLAARTELFSVRSIGTGDELRQALESASNHAAHDLIAIEIVWMPAEDNERLSSLAVEAKYPPPDLVKLQGAMVGKAICAYCAGPYPAELVCCPHCGARAAA